MDTTVDRRKLQAELDRIPEEKLGELYEVLHYFRLGIEAAGEGKPDVMQYAGIWQDMAEEDFLGFIEEIRERRSIAFSRRPRRDTSSA